MAPSLQGKHSLGMETKAVKKYLWPNICFLSCTKNDVFFSAVNKDTIFWAAQTNICPSYFVRDDNFMIPPTGAYVVYEWYLVLLSKFSTLQTASNGF